MENEVKQPTETQRRKRVELEMDLKRTLINTPEGRKDLLGLIKSGVMKKIEYHAKFEKFTGGTIISSNIVDKVIDYGLCFSNGFEIRHMEHWAWKYVDMPVTIVYERKPKL
jgi:hypothetical protein